MRATVVARQQSADQSGATETEQTNRSVETCYCQPPSLQDDSRAAERGSLFSILKRDRVLLLVYADARLTLRAGSANRTTSGHRTRPPADWIPTGNLFH